LRDLVIRTAVEADVPAMASLCQRAIRETNVTDYPPDIIARLIGDFGAAEVGRRMADRKVYAAFDGEALVGTVSLGPDKVHSVFVHAGLQRRGIGRRMMAFIEEVARGEERRALALSSSLTAVPFYAGLGYIEAGREVRQCVATVLMVKLI
jgi:GNAT superfamily N-acetyltransferase